MKGRWKFLRVQRGCTRIGCETLCRLRSDNFPGSCRRYSNDLWDLNGELIELCWISSHFETYEFLIGAAVYKETNLRNFMEKEEERAAVKRKRNSELCFRVNKYEESIEGKEILSSNLWRLKKLKNLLVITKLENYRNRSK